MPEKDFLWLNIRQLPYFRGVLRAVEARFYQEFDLAAPTLDLGCGDGDFAQITFDRKIDVGIDPWSGPVRQAARSKAYRFVLQGNGERLPFPDRSFGSAISNSVLEHIPAIDPVLSEMARVLKPGALFLFCVPNHYFLENLSVSNFFDQIDLGGLGVRYRAFFNRISRHSHCDAPEVWQERMKNAGFEVERWWHYFSPHALQILEWGHYFGLPSLLAHALFRRWILLPVRWNLTLTNSVVQPIYQENPLHPKGSYTFFVTRRVT